jgi:putative ABC transport system ATP-binding protein
MRSWTRRDVLRATVLGGGRGWQLTAAALLLMGHQTGEALVPVVIGAVVDHATETSDAGALLRWLALLAGVFTMLSLSWRFGWRKSQRLLESAEHDLRMLIAERAVDPRGHAGGDRLTGELLSTATSDAERAGLLGLLIAIGCAGLTSVGVATIALVRVSGVLTLLVLLGVPPAMALMRALGRPLERRSGVEQAAAAEAGGMATDLVTGLRVVKGLGAERAATERYRAASRASLAAAVRAATSVGWYQASAVLVPGLFLALVALVAGRLAAAGTITIGELVAVVGLAQFLATPFHILARVGVELARARASAERIAALLSAPPAVAGGVAPNRATAPPAFALRGAATGAIGPVDLEVRPGELLGVVTTDGETAAAVASWLARHSDPERGVVCLDGVTVATFDPDALRAIVLSSPHDADLFAGSVLDNVSALASTGADVSPALIAAAVDGLAGDLADGLGTDVGEQGQGLSGGQRQRVALARALAADAPVLVLHDPTTAVDPVTEAAIARGLRRLRQGRTTVVLATSPALLDVCDRVVIVDADHRAEGTHLALAERDLFYRSLVLS